MGFRPSEESGLAGTRTKVQAPQKLLHQPGDRDDAGCGENVSGQNDKVAPEGEAQNHLDNSEKTEEEDELKKRFRRLAHANRLT